MTRPDNPRVYPSQVSTQWFHEGMTLWDYFAATAMTMDSGPGYLAAERAAVIADALLAERQKRIDDGELAVSREVKDQHG